MIGLVSELLRLNGLEHGHYAEPYAGGCGLALSLLYGGHVSDIHVNDIDPAVWAFWHCVLNETDALSELIAKTPVTIDEWIKQRDTFRNCDVNDVLNLGFSTFFLNRTNRSGIIQGAGVIGGLNQNGKYKLDCRYNKEDLTRRINRIKKYASRIHLTRLDAEYFMKEIDYNLPEKSLIFIDPPYFIKGVALYTSFYKQQDHVDISKTIEKLSHPWVVTYDDVPDIREIYTTSRQYGFDISYSVREKRMGSELLVVSNQLRLNPNYEKKIVHLPRTFAA